MIRALNIALNAAHPELPLPEAVAFESSPTALFVRGVPHRVGKWALTAVYVAMTRPDGSVATRSAVESAGGVWTVTLPGSPAAGRTTAGMRIFADGEDETGAAVTGYVLGFADVEVRPLSAAPVPAPGTDAHEMWYYDEEPETPRKGDVCEIDGALKYYDGEEWQSFGGGGTTDYNDLENKPRINGNTLSGNKTAEDLGLATLEEVGELAGEVIAKYTEPQGGIPASDMTQAVQTSLAKADTAVQKSGDTMTGGLTVPNLTVGSRRENSTIGEMSTAEGFDTVASGFASHAEGDNTVANSKSSHAEGAVTEASGRDSHAEGNSTAASGDASHAEGRGTAASGDDSHAEGSGTAARNESEHAQGKYNASHTGNTAAEKTLSSIGFGSSNNDRKNAVETMQDGKTFLLGVGGYDGTNPPGQPNAAQDLATVVNGKAPLASPAFTGTPTAPTPAAADNSTKVATTAFVKIAISGISVTPLSGRNFDFATTQGVMDALKATIEALGGTVTNAPTTPAQNNQTQGE